MRTFAQQKAGLTRAINTKLPEKVIAECRKTVAEWEEEGHWPDDWSRWQRALDDTLGWQRSMDLEDLR